MQAIVKTEPRRGVSVQEVQDPVVGADEVRVEVRVAALCGSDLKLYKWEPQVVERWGRLRSMTLPHVIGHEVAGVVVEAGAGVRGVHVGDRVAAETHLACGACALCASGRMHLCGKRRILGFDAAGGFARYVVLPQRCAVRLPDDLSFEAGALCEPFGIAVHAVEQARPGSADRAWVIGCGPIGLFIVKLLAMANVGTIIATDTAPFRLECARKLGAAPLPAEERVCDRVREMTDGQGATLVFEVVGCPQTVQQALDALAPQGRLMLIGTFGGTTPIDVALQLVYREATLRGVYGRHMFDTWQTMFRILSTGQIDLESFITHRFCFSQAREAFETTLRGEGVKTLLVPD